MLYFFFLRVELPEKLASIPRAQVRMRIASWQSAGLHLNPVLWSSGCTNWRERRIQKSSYWILLDEYFVQFLYLNNIQTYSSLPLNSALSVWTLAFLFVINCKTCDERTWTKETTHSFLVAWLKSVKADLDQLGSRLTWAWVDVDGCGTLPDVIIGLNVIAWVKKLWIKFSQASCG